MSPASTTGDAATDHGPPLRWALPFGLLAAESLALSLLADFPTSGPAQRITSAARMLIPSAMGAGAAGWIIARGTMRSALREAAATLPPWRPGAALLPHLLAFTATAWLARALMGPGAAPIGAGAFLAWGACAALTALLAFATAAPLGWMARFASLHLRLPFLATAVGVLSWRVASAAEGLWGVLGTSTLHAVWALVRLARSDAMVLPAESVVGAGAFEVEIAPECSGVDGVGLILVFQALWFSLARSRVRFRRALLLLALGAAAALGANVLRIAALVLVGASGREDLALGAFHSRLGWLLFVAIALATVAAGEHLAWFRRSGTAARRDDEVPSRTVPYVAPLVAALATALATGLWSAPSFDALYVLRILAAALVLLALRKELPRPELSLSAVPVALGAAACAIWVGWPHGDGEALRSELGGLTPLARASWSAARLFGSCLVIPIVEELAFRGFLLPWLADPELEGPSPRTWTWPAVVLSSLAFGAVHREFLLGALAGLLFAAARLWRGRLGDAIVAHAVSNAGVAAAVLIGGRWDLWT